MNLRLGCGANSASGLFANALTKLSGSDAIAETSGKNGNKSPSECRLIESIDHLIESQFKVIIEHPDLAEIWMLVGLRTVCSAVFELVVTL